MWEFNWVRSSLDIDPPCFNFGRSVGCFLKFLYLKKTRKYKNGYKNTETHKYKNTKKLKNEFFVFSYFCFLVMDQASTGAVVVRACKRKKLSKEEGNKLMRYMAHLDVDELVHSIESLHVDFGADLDRFMVALHSVEVSKQDVGDVFSALEKINAKRAQTVKAKRASQTYIGASVVAKQMGHEAASKAKDCESTKDIYTKHVNLNNACLRIIEAQSRKADVSVELVKVVLRQVLATREGGKLLRLSQIGLAHVVLSLTLQKELGGDDWILSDAVTLIQEFHAHLNKVFAIFSKLRATKETLLGLRTSAREFAVQVMKWESVDQAKKDGKFEADPYQTQELFDGPTIEELGDEDESLGGVKISDADIEKDDGVAATKQATSMLGSLAEEMKSLFGAD